MTYIDGYLIPVPARKIKNYFMMAKKAGKIWKEHGALDYKEAVGEDLTPKHGTSFKKAAGAKSSETIVFAYVVFKSRLHRDQVNRKVMKDPRIFGICSDMGIPFDPTRMFYGGFTVMVDPR